MTILYEIIVTEELCYFIVSHAVSIAVHITVYSVKCSSIIIMQFRNFHVYLLEFFIFL